MKLLNLRLRLPVVSRRRYRRLAAQVRKLERSRGDLRERNRLLTRHDDCDARHKIEAYARTLEDQGRRVAQLEHLLAQDGVEVRGACPRCGRSEL